MAEINLLNKETFEQCLKCGICNDVCPMLAVNPAYPGPKRSGPDGERYRIKAPIFYEDALSYCLNCKKCEIVCPSRVPVGDIIQAARLKYGGRNHTLRNAVLSHTDLMGGIATRMAPLVNVSMGLTPVKYMMHGVMAVDQHRKFPSYSSEKFESWFRKNALKKQEEFSRRVFYFHGCYVNYNFPKLGRDLVKILNAAGYGVHLLEKELCCGVALMSNGFEKQARKNGECNVNSIRAAGGEVLTTSTTCTMMMRDEYPNILGIDNADVRERINLATRFLFREIEKGRTRLVFRKDYKMRIAYHTSCHMAKLGWSIFPKELLRMIPGVEMVELMPLCCGIAGTFGFKKENYRYSQDIGQSLFDSIRAANPETVVTECETCRWQIEMSTGYRVENTITILADALDIDATRKANNL